MIIKTMLAGLAATSLALTPVALAAQDNAVAAQADEEARDDDRSDRWLIAALPILVIVILLATMLKGGDDSPVSA